MEEIIDNEIEMIILKVQAKFPDFSYVEIRELCLDYLSWFNKKTKEQTLIKSLNKYINKEFQLEEELVVEENINKKYCLDSMPKRFLSSWKMSGTDFLVKIIWLNKALGTSLLFVDADLQVNATDKIALIWRNWTWKSTLLKMVIGMEDVDEGSIVLAKDLRIGYLSQDLFWASRDNSLREEMLSVYWDITQKVRELEEIKQKIDNNAENIIHLLEMKKDLEHYLADNDGFNKYSMQVDILKYFWFSQEQLDLKISQLSWWEQTKVQIAKFVLKDVDLLILDEPTNHLDIEGIMFLERFCELWNKWLICISHDKKFIDNVFQKIVEISEKKLITYIWNYQKYLEQKQKNYDLQLKRFNDQQKELDKQNEFIERFRYKASKAAQVQSRIKMLDKIEKLEAPVDEITLRNIKVWVDIRIPNLIMRLNKLIVWYKNPLISLPAKIEITNDKKIGIIWKNWVWKTTLFRTIMWDLKPLSGDVYINDKINIGYYSQTADDLDMDSSVIDELVWSWVGQKEARAILWWLLINWDKVEQKIWTLSWWERAKVALTKMLLQKPHVIVMDEPTNHLDLYSKEVIKNMLAEFPWVSMVVSHDRDLLESISNQVWVIKNWNMESYESLQRWFKEIFE